MKQLNYKERKKKEKRKKERKKERKKARNEWMNEWMNAYETKKEDRVYIKQSDDKKFTTTKKDIHTQTNYQKRENNRVPSLK